MPFDLSAFALDAGGNVLPDYTGEIAFFSTDQQATTPGVYRFQRTDQGIAYFPGGVTFRTTGTQELYVFDTATYTIYGYAAYEVG